MKFDRLEIKQLKRRRDTKRELNLRVKTTRTPRISSHHLLSFLRYIYITKLTPSKDQQQLHAFLLSQMRALPFSIFYFGALLLLLLLLLFSSFVVPDQNLGFCPEQQHSDNQDIQMATLGGLRDSSAEIDSLARFAVDQHNNKEVSNKPNFIFHFSFIFFYCFGWGWEWLLLLYLDCFIMRLPLC